MLFNQEMCPTVGIRRHLFRLEACTQRTDLTTFDMGQFPSHICYTNEGMSLRKTFFMSSHPSITLVLFRQELWTFRHGLKVRSKQTVKVLEGVINWVLTMQLIDYTVRSECVRSKQSLLQTNIISIISIKNLHLLPTYSTFPTLLLRRASAGDI